MDMGKSARKQSCKRSRSVTAARVARLYSFIRLLAKGPVFRSILLRKLGLNQRGFYRDIELLRAVGIRVHPDEGRYSLRPGFGAAVNLLPFPDPQLSLGQAQRLCRGKTSAHQALRRRVAQITRPSSKTR